MGGWGLNSSVGSTRLSKQSAWTGRGGRSTLTHRGAKVAVAEAIRGACGTCRRGRARNGENDTVVDLQGPRTSACGTTARANMSVFSSYIWTQAVVLRRLLPRGTAGRDQGNIVLVVQRPAPRAVCRYEQCAERRLETRKVAPGDWRRRRWLALRVKGRGRQRVAGPAAKAHTEAKGGCASDIREDRAASKWSFDCPRCTAGSSEHRTAELHGEMI